MSKQVTREVERNPLMQAQSLLTDTRLTLTAIVDQHRSLNQQLDALRVRLLANLIQIEANIAAEQQRAAEILLHP